jgi:hypothetical protein
VMAVPRPPGMGLTNPAAVMAESALHQRCASYLGSAAAFFSPPFGRAASFARPAIQASYSGVPFRGGTSAGSPPNQGGIASTMWFEMFAVVS